MLFLFGMIILVEVSATFHCPQNFHSPVHLPKSSVSGLKNCFERNTRQANVQIFPINNDTFILRENKCINYEAPFIYLLFGHSRVLLIDTGATVSTNTFPIQYHIEQLIRQWCKTNNKQRKDLQLIVAHSHNHRDHTAGDGQFRYQPFTTVVGTRLEEVIEFFQLNNWPYSVASYALDDQRYLAVIPIPGHEKSSLAFYDCATGLLLTGDSLYPGRLYIAQFSAYVQSIARLKNFIQSNNLSLTAILGTHIEMTDRARIDYPTGATYQPNERQLDMSFKHLEQLNDELQLQEKNGFYRRYRAYYEAFIVDPNPSELPPLPSNERLSNHRFLVIQREQFNDVWMSYQPMFNTSIDFQIVFHARIDNSTIQRISLLRNNRWIIESTEISLNNLINGHLPSFQAKIYSGNHGNYLSNITINPAQPFLTINSLNSSEIEPYHPLRYISYFLSNISQSQIELLLLHQIRVLPDFEGIVRVTINCTSDLSQDQLNDLLKQDGNEWAFHGLNNNVSRRLTSASRSVHAQLLGDIYSTICTMKIIEEIQCRFISRNQFHSNESSTKHFHYQSTDCPSIAMTHHRDEKFFHGFLPIWALILFAIAFVFAVIFILGLICHLAGCRKPRDHPPSSLMLNESELLTQKSTAESF